MNARFLFQTASVINALSWNGGKLLYFGYNGRAINFRKTRGVELHKAANGERGVLGYVRMQAFGIHGYGVVSGVAFFMGYARVKSFQQNSRVCMAKNFYKVRVVGGS